MSLIDQILEVLLRNSNPSFRWQSMGDWRLVLPPSRPSSDHISFVEGVLRRCPKNASVAVLGSTIEYRELLNRNGFLNVFIFEKNLDFYDYVTRMSRVDLHEKLVHGDWRETLAKFGGGFDVVLSHLTSGNVDYASREEFYSVIASSLNCSGVFVDFVLTNESGYINPDELCEYFEVAPVNILSANVFSCQALFCSRYVQELGVVDTEKIYVKLYEEFPVGFRPLIDLCQIVTPRGGLWYYGKAWSDVIRFYGKCLRIEQSIGEAISSPYHGRARHNIMKSTQIG